MKKAVLGLAVVTALIIAGCSKSDDGGDSREKAIRGKWTPVSIKIEFSDLSNNTSGTTYGVVTPGDYVDFRADGKVYTYRKDNANQGVDPYDTMPYRFTPQFCIIGQDSMMLGALTKDSLVLYQQHNTPPQYWQATHIFKK
ncbi:hypothetical protein A4D02_14475 [Niastella koreensis]|uniref:Lipocalin-like domain-containing protein n=2 Tax=Niastella koreensis TaxID=354356 RepID=G8T9A0_NIAKG|nr:hypothetical protein [Niastella koreensis]AEV98068.1 hypothetical protein Niako_1704 [Niastella koreensis GR20-10]OQP40135.1 hypothetical protein A4D02_14475 [Niastella koreensis]